MLVVEYFVDFYFGNSLTPFWHNNCAVYTHFFLAFAPHLCDKQSGPHWWVNTKAALTTTHKGGAVMAEAHLSSLARFEVYRSLSGMNRSFYLIVQRLQELENKRIFELAKLRELAALAQELQSEINHNLLQALERIEQDDCYLFGKVRAAREDLRNL
jgi:hypothetical protein